MIPKIIHQIWFGEKEIPLHLTNSWKENYPDFEYMLWNENNIPALLLNSDKFNLTESLVQKSDLLRYELLYQYGGFYVDVDTFCLNPVPEKYFKNYNLFLSYECVLPAEYFEGVFSRKTISQNEQKLCQLISNAFIASTPKNPVIKSLIDIIDNMNTDQFLNAEPWIVTGPGLLTELINQYQESSLSSSLHIFDQNLFNPFRLENPLLHYNEIDRKKTYAIHFFNSVFNTYGDIFKSFDSK